MSLMHGIRKIELRAAVLQKFLDDNELSTDMLEDVTIDDKDEVKARLQEAIDDIAVPTRQQVFQEELCKRLSNDPDPFGLHGLSLEHRLAACGLLKYFELTHHEKPVEDFSWGDFPREST